MKARPLYWLLPLLRYSKNTQCFIYCVFNTLYIVVIYRKIYSYWPKQYGLQCLALLDFFLRVVHEFSFVKGFVMPHVHLLAFHFTTLYVEKVHSMQPFLKMCFLTHLPLLLMTLQTENMDLMPHYPILLRFDSI